MANVMTAFEPLKKPSRDEVIERQYPDAVKIKWDAETNQRVADAIEKGFKGLRPSHAQAATILMNRGIDAILNG